MMATAATTQWTPNIGKMICAPDASVIVMFANGQISEPRRADGIHWGMHRRMPGTVIGWKHA